MSDFKTRESTEIEKLIRYYVERKPDVKTNILRRIKSMKFNFYVDRIFIQWVKDVDRVFNDMVNNKEILFTPGKPLRLNRKIETHEGRIHRKGQNSKVITHHV